MKNGKIVMPSFSLQDLTRGYLVGAIAGLVMTAAGVAGVYYGTGEQRSITAAASSSLIIQSALAPLVTSSGQLVSERFLSDAVRNARGAERRVAGLSADAMGADSLGPAVGGMLSAWRELASRAAAVERSVLAAEALRAKLSEILPELSRAEKKISAIKNNPATVQALISLGDSISRLQAYADSASVLLRTARIEYDLKNVSYQANLIAEYNGHPEARTLKQDADQIYHGAMPLARHASEVTAPRAELSAFVETARMAMTRAALLDRGIQSSQSNAALITVGAMTALMIGVLVLIGSVFLGMKEFDARFKRAMNQFRGGKTASRQILGDIGLISDGDFGIQLRTDDEATRDLAEGINKITVRFRGLIGRIGSLAGSIDERARFFSASSEETIAATRKQEQEVRRATDKISGTMVAISEMGLDTKATTFAAKATISAVYDGARAVQDSVERMDVIRENIQETSKRVKRLGERSQEIGQILDILGNLSGQAQVLAMNASLEANRAGEAGRGFQVVAKEVQHLHKRTGEALTEISAVVQAMQADTRDAIDAMERSTQHVVDGAFVAEIAGSSLSVIKGLTEALATMVSNIEGASASQLEMAGEASDVMGSVITLSHGATEAYERATSIIHEIGKVSKEIKTSTSEVRA